MYSLPPLSVLNSRRTSLTHILHRREEQNRAFSISTELDYWWKLIFLLVLARKQGWSVFRSLPSIRCILHAHAYYTYSLYVFMLLRTHISDRNRAPIIKPRYAKSRLTMGSTARAHVRSYARTHAQTHTCTHKHAVIMYHTHYIYDYFRILNK